MRLRGGQGSDSEDFDDSDSPGPSKKRKVESGSKTRKTKAKGKGKAKAVAEPVDQGLRITLSGKNGAPGMFVDEVIDITEAPECWEIPQHHRVAYILDVSGTPECLRLGPQKVGTVDRYVKKQCQDAWDGGTGSKKSGLAKVTILNEGAVISCRRSNLTCNGFYTCSLAAPDHLADFERWDDLGSATQDLISDPNRAAKIAEASDVVATATAFYRSAMNRHCKAVDGDQVACGGHAVLRKFRGGPANGKAHFVGFSNWSSGDDLEHRFTSVPREVREAILCQLFRGEEIDNKQCPRIHFRNNKHVLGELTSQQCPAELLILIPVGAADLRAVIIPKSGIPHNHPTFLRSKVPFTAAKKYRSAIDAVGLIGTTTLHVDKYKSLFTFRSAASTKATLGGLLPEELHPSLINKRKRRGMVKDAQLEHFPEGMGLKDMHVIITINADLAALVHDASWIMVDTTFAVVHGSTNEWRLLIWLSGFDKRTVIGRVWTDRATRGAFVLVWSGIFDAIERITGKAVNFKVFSRTGCLLGAIGDAEGAQAQGLGDVIILRGMNTSTVNGTSTVTVDSILLYWWAHKISYPWLLPSLNRHLTSMSHLHWDLTPGDTNPIEGSHVQDNQVNATNRTLIEAILLAREYDSNTARVIKATIASGVMENGNNSLEARYAQAARRQARTRANTAEGANTDGGKRFKAKLKVAEQQSRTKDLEIQRLQAVIAAGPSTPRQIAPPITDSTPRNDFSPVAGPYRLPALNVFPGLPAMPRVAEPRSDFNYQSAMRSDIPDATLRRIAYPSSDDVDLDAHNHPLYSVDSDDEVLAPDPYPSTPQP
ncbi:hypothetical protein B0H17DRAFT_1214515 [Mycena rosella]|uniref:Uncharacterized protein n=1 Tax=Mycena rosella TaxID=1033263 RepID=A0AAD7CNH3_MYCRO|nr:hypothetical protein B0H17DRAFT_1214515 [Mycena rosella]